MAVDWNRFVNDWWSQVPSPHEPRLTIGQLPTAVKMATRTKFGGHASFAEAANWQVEFDQMNQDLLQQGKQPMTPEDYSHALERIAPLSYTYHNRPPTMKEIGNLGSAHPKDVRSYYAELPDKNYPHVTSGDMIAALQAASPHAQIHLNRRPNKLEAAHLVHSRANPADYYRMLKADQEAKGGSQAGQGGDSLARGLQDAGRRPSPA